MYMQMNIQTNVEIRSLVDLPKIKSLMENLKMKINKSKLAREMGVDRRTINKYLDGFTLPSIQLAKSAGMKYECISEGFIYEYGEWTDHLVYSINAK